MQYVNGFRITFALYALIATLIFLNILNEYLQMNEFNNVLKLSGVYFTVMLVGGFGIGYFDKEVTQGSSQSFIYHFITFVSVTSLALPWFLFTLDFNLENVLYILIQTAAWGVGLFFHWFFTRSPKRLVQ